MTNENTAIVAQQDVSTLATAGVGATYCSLKADPKDRAASAKVFNAMNSPEHRVSDFINKEIAVRDVLVSICEVANEETGEISQAPRVVLIDEDGKAYQCVSNGMFNAVSNAIKVFGAPTWEPPLNVKIRQQAVGKGSMLTFDVV